tara:strand:- start:458 stop:1090 length:633 start_codon:yes stop_codon:yes gene_type:complete
MEPGIQKFPSYHQPQDYPGPKNFKAWAGSVILRFFGWRVAGQLPDVPKWVAIGAPHTSNWDFPFMVAASWVMGVRLRWLGKAALFKGPWGGMMKALGGIPVDRTQSNDMVQDMVDWFEKSDHLVVAVPPSGTRAFRDHWKTGFYYIAQQAGVPVGLGILDFKEKAAGFTGLLVPSGDIEKDFEALREFYAPIGAKFADKVNTVQLRPKDP